MKKAIFTIGCSGSGKSTWASEYAKSHKVEIINRDDIRFEETGATGWKDYKFTRENEDRVTTIQRSLIAEAGIRGIDIIVADTNLNKKIRNGLRQYCESLGFEVEYKDFPATLEDLWKRDRFRGDKAVGRDVLYKQWQNWLEYIDYPKYTPVNGTPQAIIFDVDGTLAHMVGRGPFEWDKVGSDVPDRLVREMLWDFQNRGYRILIMSGRDSVCRDKTFNWLMDNGIIYDGLFMRKEGDMRKDGIIKTELFWEHVAPYYNVVACVDDRPAMVRAWYDLGIRKVISVANPNVEF